MLDVRRTADQAASVYTAGSGTRRRWLIFAAGVVAGFAIAVVGKWVF